MSSPYVQSSVLPLNEKHGDAVPVARRRTQAKNYISRHLFLVSGVIAALVIILIVSVATPILVNRSKSSSGDATVFAAGAITGVSTLSSAASSTVATRSSSSFVTTYTVLVSSCTTATAASSTSFLSSSIEKLSVSTSSSTAVALAPSADSAPALSPSTTSLFASTSTSSSTPTATSTSTSTSTSSLTTEGLAPSASSPLAFSPSTTPLSTSSSTSTSSTISVEESTPTPIHSSTPVAPIAVVSTPPAPKQPVSVNPNAAAVVPSPTDAVTPLETVPVPAPVPTVAPAPAPVPAPAPAPAPVPVQVLTPPPAPAPAAAVSNALIANGIPLRIVPLGASITYGTGSSDGNGYRLDLQNKLAGNAGPLQYLGSVRAGSMPDNFVEGHPGAVISQVAQFAQLSDGNQPNIFLVHVGTNDLINDAPSVVALIPTAPARLGALIDELVAAAPSAAVLISYLIHTGDPAHDARVQAFNAALPAIVAPRVANGHRVLLVTAMGAITGPLNADGIHPTDAGYALMANVWFDAIKQADSKGWITKTG